MSRDEEARREALAARLKAGLETEVTPRADDDAAVQKVIARLRQLAPEDDEGRLKIAGFTDQVYDHEGLEQACEACMYFLVHRRFCELPELMLPVEPHWSCRLWRI